MEVGSLDVQHNVSKDVKPCKQKRLHCVFLRVQRYSTFPGCMQMKNKDAF